MRRKASRILVAGIGVLLMLFPAGIGRAEGPRIIEEIELPAPDPEGGMSLARALSLRRSVRTYAPNQPLSLGEIGQLFWAAQGLTGPERRTAPSAGALYPLEIYAVTRKGLYHYRPHGHRALAAWQGGLVDSLATAAGSRSQALGQAASIFVITGVVSRTETRYGRRAMRYATLEAGHAAQNLLLQATALGLDAVPVGAFSDDRLGRVLDLPADQTPFYMIPVGRPARD